MMNYDEIIMSLSEIADQPTEDGMVDGVNQQTIRDALALLKEKEPVKPFVGNYWKNSMGRCGHCKAPLPALEGLRSKFCWMCGRPVKWDE